MATPSKLKGSTGKGSWINFQMTHNICLSDFTVTQYLENMSET